MLVKIVWDYKHNLYAFRNLVPDKLIVIDYFVPLYNNLNKQYSAFYIPRLLLAPTVITMPAKSGRTALPGVP